MYPAKRFFQPLPVSHTGANRQAFEWLKAPIKKPGQGRVLEAARPGAAGNQNQLLDFAFFVDHVLANHGIKLFDFHFFGHIPLVFVGGVEVTSARGGVQTNLVAHGNIS
jgi:hypothetical protein